MNKFIGLLLLSIIFVQCGQDKDTMILKNQLGKMTKNTTIEELDKIFKNDSIEKLPVRMPILSEDTEYTGKMRKNVLGRY